MAAENPYAAPLHSPDPGDDQRFDPTLLATSVSFVFIVSCATTFLCASYLLWTLYLVAWLIQNGDKLATASASLVLRQAVMMVCSTGLYGYGAYRDWMYFRALKQLINRSISWRTFARSHASFWRAGVIVSLTAVLLTFVPWAIGLVLANR